ncbi:MAG TPA: sigma-70 family RNA polymerase sigma factor [Pseudobacteroides sp.]|uniref:sigma-70 family RNA polymerase sigma factor n=1 Tax=Pseudobacteroides sp. TaxID=1968840 RepID=UPI002F95D862
MNPNDFEQKITLAKRGDKGALLDLVLAKKDQLYRIAYSYLKNENDSLDVMQDTLITAFKQIGTLKETKYFYTWYTRILINMCKRVLNDKKKIIMIEELQKNNTCPSNDKESWIDVKNSIEKLKPEFREVVYMRYFEDLSIKDISKVINCPEGTVKSRLYYAIQELKNDILGNKEENNYGLC